MRVWISKYALSQGIFEMDAEQDNSLVYRRSEGGFRQFFHGEGREWHRTYAGAIERAEVMRDNKLRSLKKQIDKLERLQFTKAEAVE